MSVTKPRRKISKKTIEEFKEGFKYSKLFTDKAKNNIKSEFKYDKMGNEIVFLPKSLRSSILKNGGVLTRSQRTQRTQQNEPDITQSTNVTDVTRVPENSITMTPSSRTYKKNNTRQTNKNIQLSMKDIEKWRQNPLVHPTTKKKIKEDNVSFVDIKTEYGKLYSESFNLIWDNLNIDSLEKHDDNLSQNIKYIKSKLPDLHCYHVNDDNDSSFDYLFYISYLKMLETKNDGFFVPYIQFIVKALPDYLKYVQIYKIISNKMNIFLKSNTKYSVLTNPDNVADFILQLINDFLYKFMTINMGEIEKIVVHKQLLTYDSLKLIQNYLRTMDDIRNINQYFGIEISSNTMIDIFDMIQDKVFDMCIDKNINKREYKKIIENLNIGSFIVSTAKDLIDIALVNQTPQNNDKYKILQNSEIENEEPIIPFLKRPPPLPDYPDKEDIEKLFKKPNQDLSSTDKREIDEIFKMKLQRYKNAKNEIDNFPTAQKDYDIKLREYEDKKASYDKKLETIQKKSISPLKDGSVEKTPPNKGKTIAQLLRELIGDGVDKCNLDDNGELSTPFTTDFTPLKDYSLVKLQLVVKIHTRDEDNNIVRTDCGNPIDLYNYIISFYNENRKPIHPLTRKLLTEENIDAIMEKLPFAVNNPNIERPIAKEDNADSNLFISFVNKNDYYTAYIMRNFGGDFSQENESMHGIDIPIYQICSFPSNIGSENSIDRTSTGMAFILDTLFSERRLLHNYTSPYGVLRPDGWTVLAITTELIKYKNKSDWTINRATKKPRSRQEIEELFFMLYDQIARL